MTLFLNPLKLKNMIHLNLTFQSTFDFRNSTIETSKSPEVQKLEYLKIYSFFFLSFL